MDSNICSNAMAIVTTGLAWSKPLVSVGSVNTNGTLITNLLVGDFGAVFWTWHNAY